MIEVKLANESDTLLRLVRHHARALEGIVLELFAYMTLVLGEDDAVWTIKQSRIGANSFSLSGRGQGYHFRSVGNRSIYVYDSYQHGKIIATLATREDARKFVKGLVPVAVAA